MWDSKPINNGETFGGKVEFPLPVHMPLLEGDKCSPGSPNKKIGLDEQTHQELCGCRWVCQKKVRKRIRDDATLSWRQPERPLRPGNAILYFFIILRNVLKQFDN